MLKTISCHDQKFELRFLEPADVEAYVAFFNGLNQESIRCRFGHLIANLTPSTARPRTEGNTAEAKAIAIFADHQDRIVAIGRCFLDATVAEAEVAIVVAESMRRLGLGRILLHELLAIAEREGSKTVSAYIATENAPVIKLLQSVGFKAEPANDDEDLKLILHLHSPKIAAGLRRSDHEFRPAQPRRDWNQ
ncbi:MAG: GNAT family N-acetyltransferase [Chthoniobacteraceae bacterium]